MLKMSVRSLARATGDLIDKTNKLKLINHEQTLQTTRTLPLGDSRWQRA